MNIDHVKFNNKAISFYNKKDYKTSLKWYKKCLPDCDKQIYYNIGLCYHSLKDYDSAIKHYEIYEKMSGIENIYEKSLCYLFKGDVRKGLEIYKTRYGRKSVDGVNFPELPLNWVDKIDDLKGKNVLVLNEQGFGDEFLFSKSFTELSRLCSSCHIQVYSETINLFKELYPDLNFFSDRTLSMEFVQQFDCFTSTGEMFALYNIDGAKSYKMEDNQLKNGRVGIFFAANPKAKNSKERSISPNLFKPLLSRYKLVNLQKGYNLDFCENPELNDFLDTRNVIKDLDFVISIDSSVSNLCGMLGKECYLVNKKYLDWRYVINFYDSIEIITPDEISDF